LATIAVVLALGMASFSASSQAERFAQHSDTGVSRQRSLAQMKHYREPIESNAQSHSYVGMWVTKDGCIRHQLLANGRYVEARGTREKAYQGRYEIMGNDIEYWDDTGFTADGTFINGVLHHAGMIMHREETEQ
jgi:hypothetical protein